MTPRFLLALALVLAVAGCNLAIPADGVEFPADEPDAAQAPLDAGPDAGLVVDLACSPGDGGCPYDAGGSCAWRADDAGCGYAYDTGFRPDVGEPDVGAPDVGDPDAGVADVGNPDAGVADVGSLDASAPDVGAPDTGAPDVGASDTGAPDVGAPDVGAPDVGSPDIGTPDIGTDDIGFPDIGSPDTGLGLVCPGSPGCPDSGVGGGCTGSACFDGGCFCQMGNPACVGKGATCHFPVSSCGTSCVADNNGTGFCCSP